ncbi:hypothetical protein LguiA_005711 [Lonicera macranthoides]
MWSFNHFICPCIKGYIWLIYSAFHIRINAYEFEQKWVVPLFKKRALLAAKQDNFLIKKIKKQKTHFGSSAGSLFFANVSLSLAISLSLSLSINYTASFFPLQLASTIFFNRALLFRKLVSFYSAN